MKTSISIYKRFVEFEERAGAIYLRLASHFSKDPKLCSFWLDMAMHEKQHAGLLQFCLQQELFATDLPDSADIRKVAELFKRLEKDAADPKMTAANAGVDYKDLGADYLDRFLNRRTEQRLVHRLRSMGYEVRAKTA